MARPRRRELDAEAARRCREQCARLGGQVRESRRRRRLTQRGLAERVGVVQSTISALERGHGGSAPLELWQRVFLALNRSLVIDAPRDPLGEPADAGHLRVQELILRLARGAGYAATFELPSRPADPTRSSDVGLRDDRRRLVVLVECWNTIGDVGAAARSSARKVAEAEAAAVAFGGDRSHRVATCWVVRATRANRDLVQRYPEVFRSRFPGSSLAWVRALVAGGDPPVQPGLVWADVAATNLTPWRVRATPR